MQFSIFVNKFKNMAKNINSIKLPVQEELSYFDEFLKSTLKTDNFILNQTLKYIFKTKGKQIRPLLVLLSAKLIGEVNTKTYIAATLIELLHTATLVHDDIVDNSELRRSFFSLKSLWKSKITVLVGDYLLSQGLLLSIENNAFDVLKVVSEAVNNMSKGELLQIEKARKINLSLESYFEIIGMKTASLIKASTKCGAISVTEDKYVIDKIAEIGWNIGIAFQIKDDLFDYETTKIIGKPGGNDIQEGKITLPVIYCMEEMSKKEQRQFLKMFTKKHKSDSDIKSIQRIIIDSNAIKSAKKTMFEYSNKSKKILYDNFKCSSVYSNYDELIDFIIERKK